MNQESREKQGKPTPKSKDYLFLGGTVLVALILLLLYPEKWDSAWHSSTDYFLEMMMILPGVMVIMGLFNVFISKEQIVKYFGKAAGVKGIGLAILFGSVPTGPLYIAFPLAASLLKKGARVSNIIIFLTAWACIKLPQELVEWKFLGLEFTVLRLLLTITFAIVMGLIIEKIIERNDGKTETL